jgi:hypothetical protein
VGFPSSISSVQWRVALVPGALLLTLLLGLIPADRRVASLGILAAPNVVQGALHSGPTVAPMRRTQPVMPPWPAALVAAGDIVPPMLAPDGAPLPERKNAELAVQHLRAAAKAGERATVVAEQRRE